MLKKSAFKRIMIATLSLIIAFVVYLFPSKNIEENDNITYLNSIKSPIFLIDKNDYVARVNILKKGNDINETIKYLIDSLTIDSSSTIYLPENFYAVIPAKTKLLNFSLNDKILKLNFSKEFLNMEAAKEEKTIEALIYTLTELNEIDKIMLFVNNERLLKLPNTGSVLPIVLDRSFGINKTYDIRSLKNINKITTYYVIKNTNFNYYIPVTEINNDDTEKIQIIIRNLKTSPINQTNLTSYLASTASLTNYEILENSINLSFNNNLIANILDKSLLEEVKYSIFLSLKDSYNVKSVIFELPNNPTSVLY